MELFGGKSKESRNSDILADAMSQSMTAEKLAVLMLEKFGKEVIGREGTCAGADIADLVSKSYAIMVRETGAVRNGAEILAKNSALITMASMQAMNIAVESIITEACCVYEIAKTYKDRKGMEINDKAIDSFGILPAAYGTAKFLRLYKEGPVFRTDELLKNIRDAAEQQTNAVSVVYDILFHAAVTEKISDADIQRIRDMMLGVITSALKQDTHIHCILGNETERIAKMATSSDRLGLLEIDAKIRSAM